MADSLRARTLINLSAVLYEQAAARTGLPAEVGNIDLDFVPSVAFISNVHMADSLRARILINLSAVLLRARTLINLSAVLYEQADARSGLSAEVSIMDLDFVPGVAFDAMGNVELTGDFLTALLNLRSLALKRPALSGSDLNCGRTDPTIAYTVPYPDLKKYLGNSGSIYVLRSVDEIWADVADVFDTVVSKSDEVPTRELSSYIKTELLRDNDRKFYRLVITGEDTHCKQIIKKAYIMLLERALLILFMT
ncbi:hypothetical protein HBI27_173070 [Parastagonospora nodorum]|nr:hypothetical protein HBI27_173070 [Parastagonospora nodorum]